MRLSKLRRRLAWYVYRARAMPLEELPFRVTEQVHRRRGRRPTTAEGVSEPGPRSDTSLSELILSWRHQPGVGDFWQARAAAAARGEITVFGRRWSMTPDGLPDWDVDPATGFRWPQDYCFDVPLLPPSAEPVEVKYVWELSRLLYLLPIAAHAASEHDEEAARLCRSHLQAWILSHPPQRGVTWRSGIELAHRVLVFVVVLELISSVQGSDPALEARVGQAVAEHVDWIRRFPSRFSSANNHRVTELIGLLIAASAYPELGSADERDRWWTELSSVALLQFHADGGPAEQATMYAFQVLEWLSISLRLAQRQGRHLDGETLDRVRRAAGFLANLTDGAGHAVRIGDDDDSRLLTAALPHDDLPRAALDLVAQELGGSAPGASTGLTSFPDGGYTVWRSGSAAEEILWVLDHAPLGMGHLAAHAHADALAVFLHVGGRPILVDAGTYLYHSGGNWRDHFRRTAEHNTVTVEGEDSSLMAGPFSWRRGHRADGRLVGASASGDDWLMEAEHGGYAKRFGVIHRRTLEGVGPCTFQLTDRLEGATRPVAIRWSLLLAPGLEVVRTSDGWTVHADGFNVLRLTVPPEWRAAMKEEPASYSPAFGQMEKVCRLALDGELGGGSAIRIGIDVPDR